MSQIASKNLYELLGNDPDQDPELRVPEPPTQAVDKPVARTGKRNAGVEAPAAARDAPRSGAGGRGGRNDGQTRGEQGGLNQRGDDGARSGGYRRDDRERGEGRGRGRGRGRGYEGGRGRGGRGDRGDRGGAPRDDRHSHTGVGDHDKQAAHGWGAEQDGNAEWADEKAGDAIANAEANNESGFTPDTSGGDPAFTNGPDGETAAEEAAPEPEDKTKSYDQYMAEQAEKRLALSGNTLEVRKANEGSSQKFPTGTAFSRDPEAENFMAGSGGKARKAKDTQDKKERVVLDGSYYQQPDQGGRGGGRGGRGGRGRGEGRGEFRGGRGGDRRGRGGDFRGGARGDRGGDRGDRSDRGGSRGGFNATDDSAFPALGA